jgi:hypothetical protein
MAYIPDDAEWYLADVILEVKPDDGLSSRVWINTHLIRAGSPEEAYTKAEQLGRNAEETNINATGGAVAYIYRGLASLQVIYEKLEDGAEISWTEYDDLSSEEIEKFVCPKDELEVFDPLESQETNPRYLSKALMPP